MTAVALRFDLPPLQDQVGSARAPEIAKWIAGLPLVNTGEAARMLLERLAHLNRTAIEDGERLQVLECFREPVHGIALALIASYEHQTRPVSGPGRMAADRAQGLYTEMALGYQRLAVAASQRANRTQADRGHAALSVQRAICYLCRALAVRFSLRNPAPAGIWRTLHDLYSYAETEGIADAPVADALNTCVTASSVSHVYKQALLLNFADPYQLPARMVERVHRYLDAMAPLAELTRAVPAMRPDCQFVLNLASDRAGVSNADSPAVTTEARYRFMTTVGLACAMHNQLTALQSGAAVPMHGLEAGFFATQGADLLKRLLVAWGVHPKRRFARIARDGVPAEVHIGLEAICRAVSGGATFERSSSLVGPLPRPPERPRGEATTADADSGEEGGASWGLLDESASGFRLGCTHAPREPVHIGDLVCACVGSSRNKPEIGMIRWVMIEPGGTMRVGVQRLAPSAQTVGLYPSDDPDTGFHVVLRLPAIAALKQPETLITPRGVFRPDRPLVLDDGACTHQITAMRPVVVTGSFEQFEYRFRET
jgi:hypothetical protein